MNLGTLIGAYDFQEARVRNKIKKQKAIEISNQLKQAKAVTEIDADVLSEDEDIDKEIDIDVELVSKNG